MLIRRGLALVNLLVALLGTASAATPAILYRGEKETPAQVIQQGYLRCDAYKNGLEPNTATTLEKHAMEPRANRPDDPWLSTTSDKRMGENYAHLNSGTLYEIDSTIGGVDYRSVEEHYAAKGERMANKIVGDKEYSAWLKIPLAAIIAWTPTTVDMKMGTRVPNPHYGGGSCSTRRLGRRALCNGAKPPTSNAVKPPTSNTVKPPTSNAVKPPTSNAVKPPTSNAVKPSTSNAVKPPTSNTVKPPTSNAVKPPTSNAVKPPNSNSIKPPKSSTATPRASPIKKPVRFRA